MTEHVLKVQAPYLDALISGDKTFEVRRNDRGFQRGDVLWLREWDPSKCARGGRCKEYNCSAWGAGFHREVTFVYSGDPRFGGLEPGFVVLALGPVSS